MKNNRLLARLLLATTLTLISWQSIAAYIEGQIDFTGSAILTLNGDDSAIAQIDIVTAEVELATGVYADYGVLTGDTATFADPLDLSSTPINSLWSVGGFSFDLISLVVNTVIDLPLPYDIAAVQGEGIIHHDDFEDTLGSWTFTTQTDGSLKQFSFSATVPEPSALVLLSLGIIGLMLARRKLK